MAYQSLYRRYRPQRFEEVRGQDHVSHTLRNAVRDGRVGHAYLFSGPRGTGKTSTARILAKALNCATPEDGEPCGRCQSCVDIAQGRSLDVQELDAASNRGVDAMRDLVARVALGTAGRWKVYIVDEVHMLTPEASNTLLKTLEEPPAHVVFVLATTEPHKVLPTIRSRTQHFEFRLLAPQVLAEHLRWVAADANLEVAPEVIDLVARRGSGSARDALSALDQAAAAGGVESEPASSDDIVEALCDHDAGRALAAVAERCAAGHDPRQLTRDVVERLREAFLTLMARSLVGLPDEEAERVEGQAKRLGPAALVRAMELLGQVLVDMREAPDPRILLEVALVRLCRTDLDTSPAAIVERLERLERLERSASQRPGGAPTTTPTPTTPSAPSGPRGSAPPPPSQATDAPLPSARPTIGAIRSRLKEGAGPPAAPSGPPAEPPAASAPADAESRPFPTRDELTLAWGDSVIPRVNQRVKVRFRNARFISTDGGVAVVGFPNPIERDRAEEARGDAEHALAAHFGRPVPLRLVLSPSGPGGGEDGGFPAAAVPDRGPNRQPSDPEEAVDWDELQDAPPEITSPVDYVIRAFGAEVVEE